MLRETITLTLIRSGSQEPIPARVALEQYILPAIRDHSSYQLHRADFDSVQGIDVHGNILHFQVGLCHTMSQSDPLACRHCDGKGEVPVTPGQPGDGPMECPTCNGTGSAGVDGDPSRVWGVDDPR